MIVAFIQQLAALRLELEQAHYAQAVLSGMVLVCLLALGVSALWQRVSIVTLRPFILWFSTGSFLLFCYMALTSPEALDNSLYVAHLILVAASYVLLPMITAATVSGLSAALLAGVALLSTPADLTRMLSTLFTGFLLSFLTVYGHGLRSEYAEAPRLPAVPEPGVTLARLQEFVNRHPEPSGVALLVLEVELYRNLLDVYGPVTISQLMERLERQVRRHLSSTDYVWRYGESRYLVLFTQVDAAGAAQRGHHLVQRCGEVQVRRGDVLQVSGGLAFLNERSSLADVADLALARLYRARRSGAAQFIGNSAVRT